MSPDQKETLKQIADRLYEDISKMHEITRTLVRERESEQVEEQTIYHARLSMRSAAAKIDELMFKMQEKEANKPA